MKITDAKVFVGGPKKNYVTLKITTDEGVYGLGDATLNNRETLPAKYLQDYLIPNLIGKDPRNSEDIWQFLYRGAYFRRGPIAMAAYGAVDTALWDIKGKPTGMSLYQLFGGKSREGAMVYAHCHRGRSRRSAGLARLLRRAGLQGDPRAMRHTGHAHGQLRHPREEG
tara:strand:+ start:120 stop:623 length:504 start_codon:yes stop_codon:yes gene_type:complete